MNDTLAHSSNLLCVIDTNIRKGHAVILKACVASRNCEGWPVTAKEVETLSFVECGLKLVIVQLNHLHHHAHDGCRLLFIAT